MRWRSLVLLSVLLAGCGSGDPNEPGAPDYQVVAASGGTRSGPAGGRLLGVPIVVVTGPDGQVAPGVTVTLSLASGAAQGFALPETKVATGIDGIARADVVLGSSGSAEIRAEAPGSKRPAATVTVTASAAPTLTGVQPATFGAGDEVVLSGTDLPSAAGGSTVLVGGVQATVLAASATSLRVRAPACVAPGAVQVTVSVGGRVTTNAMAATYTSSTAQPALEVLEGVTVPASQVAGCLSLAAGTARYLIVPQYATPDDAPAAVQGSRPGFTLSTALGGAPAAARDEAWSRATLPLRGQRRADQVLRERERELAPFAAGAGAAAARTEWSNAAEELALNDTRSFRVLTDLQGDGFTSVTARLKFIGENMLIYVDEQAPQNGFTDPQLANLGRLFDTKLYPAAVDAFGHESDIDGNGHVVVLLTPVVNRLTPASECDEFGYITGFFYGLDLTPSLANSNKAEVFYSVVPDPAGTLSCAHTVAEVNSLVPATFIHELQHMISWNQHVLVRGGPVEELWLNEGLSHMAEELGSLLYERDPNAVRTDPRQLFPDSSQGFINGNLLNAYGYLERPFDISTSLFRDGGSLEERGASWLFLRWLADQKGEGILRRLVETRLTGTANVADKAGEPFARLFGDFGVALYAADRLNGVDPAAIQQRYRYTSRDWRQIFRRLHDTNAPGANREFPILAEALTPGQPRSGSMVPGSLRFFLLQTTVEAPRATVRFVPSTGESFPAALGAQVTVFRLPNP